MPSIVAFQLKQVFNQNPLFFSKWYVYKQPENVIFCLRNFTANFKDVTANGHDKLNRLMIAQTPSLFSAKN